MPPKGKTASPEHRAKLAEGVRRAYAEGRHPRGVRGWKHPEGTREKISAAHLRRSALIRSLEEGQ